MRLALVISSAYAENTVVPCRESFQDTAKLFADRIGAEDAAFTVRCLEATRDLPEALDFLLTQEVGKLESLLIHFSGYVAVKAERGPALLLDGPRLRAYPLSRLRAALEECAQQSLVIIDALPVVDAEQSSSLVSKTVCEGLASPDGTITTLAGIGEEWPVHRRGAHRLTDLFTLCLSHLSRKVHGSPVTSNSVYQQMQAEVLSFGSIPGLEHRAGFFDFVVLEGPLVFGLPDTPFGAGERTTQPVAIFEPIVPTAPSATPQGHHTELSREDLGPVSDSLRESAEHRDATLPEEVVARDVDRAEACDEPAAEQDGIIANASDVEAKESGDDEAAAVEDVELIDEGTQEERITQEAPPSPIAPNVARKHPELPPELQGLADIPLGRSPEGRIPTLAETPQARAQMQRDWLSEAAYFPSAPPPRVAPVVPVPMRHPQAVEPQAFALRVDAEPAEDELLPPPPPPPPPPHAESSALPQLAVSEAPSAESPQSSIAHYEEILLRLEPTDGPGRALAQANLGDALRKAQRHAEALFAYERALDLDPHQQLAFDGACSLYRAARDYAGLVSTIHRKLEATFDDNAKLSLLDLIVHVWSNEAKEPAHAIEALEEKLTLVPDDIDSLELLIAAHDRQGDIFGRLECRERLARLSSAEPELRARRFVEAAKLARDELEDQAKTFVHLESAIELGVYLQESLREAEALLGDQSRWDEVIELYERALEIEQDPELRGPIAKQLTALVLAHASADVLKPSTLEILSLDAEATEITAITPPPASESHVGPPPQLLQVQPVEDREDSVPPPPPALVAPNPPPPPSYGAPPPPPSAHSAPPPPPGFASQPSVPPPLPPGFAAKVPPPPPPSFPAAPPAAPSRPSVPPLPPGFAAPPAAPSRPSVPPLPPGFAAPPAAPSRPSAPPPLPPGFAAQPTATPSAPPPLPPGFAAPPAAPSHPSAPPPLPPGFAPPPAAPSHPSAPPPLPPGFAAQPTATPSVPPPLPPGFAPQQPEATYDAPQAAHLEPSPYVEHVIEPRELPPREFDETLDEVQQHRQLEPRNHEILHRVFEQAVYENIDIAANIGSILVHEGVATAEESEYGGLLSTDALPSPRRALENTDYESLLYPADFDRSLLVALRQLETTLLSADVFAQKGSAILPKDAPVLDPETSTVTLARSFLWTSKLLAVAVPELIVTTETPVLLRLLPREARPCFVVSRQLGSGFNLPELAYLAARHSTMLLPGFKLRAQNADPRALGSVLYVLFAVVNGSSRGLKALGEYEQKLGKRLGSMLEKNSHLMGDAIRFFAGDTPSLSECEGRALTWLRGVDQVRLRVALLACGCPATALRINQDAPIDGPWTSEEQLDLLAAYAGSREHTELRARLGIAQSHD